MSRQLFAMWPTHLLNCQERQFQEFPQYQMTHCEQVDLVLGKSPVLWRSTSPPEMMSARLSQAQAADVNLLNSESFAAFNATYKGCHQIRKGGHGGGGSIQPRPPGCG